MVYIAAQPEEAVGRVSFVVVFEVVVVVVVFEAEVVVTLAVVVVFEEEDVLVEEVGDPTIIWVEAPPARTREALVLAEVALFELALVLLELPFHLGFFGYLGFLTDRSPKCALNPDSALSRNLATASNAPPADHSAPSSSSSSSRSSSHSLSASIASVSPSASSSAARSNNKLPGPLARTAARTAW